MQNSFISLISTSIFLDTIFTTCTKFLDCSSLVSFDDGWKPSSQCFLTLISLSFQRNRSSYGSKICGCQVKRTRDGNRLSLAIFLTNDLISKIKSLRKPTWSSETFFFFFQEFRSHFNYFTTIHLRWCFATSFRACYTIEHGWKTVLRQRALESECGGKIGYLI